MQVHPSLALSALELVHRVHTTGVAASSPQPLLRRSIRVQRLKQTPQLESSPVTQAQTDTTQLYESPVNVWDSESESVNRSTEY